MFYIINGLSISNDFPGFLVLSVILLNQLFILFIFKICLLIFICTLSFLMRSKWRFNSLFTHWKQSLSDIISFSCLKLFLLFPSTQPAYSDNYINNIIKSIIFKIACQYIKITTMKRWYNGSNNILNMTPKLTQITVCPFRPCG